MVINKSKTIKIIEVAIIIIAIIMIIFSLTRKTPADLSADAIDIQLQGLVSELVVRDTSIRNCFLAVMKGDGSYSWAGAGGIAHEENREPMAKDQPVYVASILKLYTATVIMRLYEMGELSLDDPISKYLPGELINGIHIYKGKDYSREIIIEQLLSQTSGIADYYEEKPEGGKSVFETLLEEPEREWKDNETIEWARDRLTPNFPPGTGTSYSDTNFDLLGKIIESITGQPLHVVYNDLLFHPLGLTHTWLVERSAPENLIPSAPADVFYKYRNITRIRSNSAYWPYLVSTAEDMIDFLKALNEGRIISKKTLQLMHNWNRMDFPLQYGFGTMYFSLPRIMSKASGIPPLWGHSGSTGSFLYYSEDLDLYLAGTTDCAGADKTPFFKLIGPACKLFITKD